jgi:hypothetical protein
VISGGSFGASSGRYSRGETAGSSDMIPPFRKTVRGGNYRIYVLFCQGEREERELC